MCESHRWTQIEHRFLRDLYSDCVLAPGPAHNHDPDQAEDSNSPGTDGRDETATRLQIIGRLGEKSLSEIPEPGSFPLFFVKGRRISVFGKLLSVLVNPNRQT